MILDSSALLAVVFGEDEGPRFMQAILDESSVRMSAVNWVESAVVVDGRRDRVVVTRLEQLLRVLRIEVVAVTPAIADRAQLAYRQFGRKNHPARLNFADTFSYALAAECDEPLLFKGNDFSQTDIEPALKG